jgi:hypothetical protein
MESGKNLPQENAKNSRDIEQEETEETEAVGYRGLILQARRLFHVEDEDDFFNHGWAR